MSNDESPIDPAIEDAASEDDRAWFAARPHRQFRLRRLLPGELGAPAGDWVLVTQLRPGVRSRAGVQVTGGCVPLNVDAELRQVAAAIFEGQPVAIRNGRVVPLADLDTGDPQ